MKTAWAVLGLLVGVAGQVNAESLSQNEARALCETEVSATQADQTAFQFRRNGMNSYRHGEFTFMFNYRAEAQGDTVARKVKCVVSKTGELQTLEVLPGSWSF